ncbi:MAG: hypothetical protein M3Q05_06645 [Bacteroidota bacterium]|nr:hypothetical protein [Bacteroidota bacterium]
MVSCEEPDDIAAVKPEPVPEQPGKGAVVETPSTPIPDELVGTWYADQNPNPMTTNWEQGTFQGEEGLREYRTMVFTKDGKNAIEFTSTVYKTNDEVKQYMFKRIGTLEYKTNPNSLTFHVQSGRVRFFSNKVAGYQEADLVNEDWPTYLSVLVNPEATTYTSSTNFLSAKRSNGATEYSVKYIKADNCNNGGGTTNPDDLYGNPPASGTYVQIANKYYPTVTIGKQEWMAVNYAGDGGMKDSTKPHFGTFVKFMDLKDIPVPAGWRIPTKQDYKKLLLSQGLELMPWEATNGEDVASKKLLGQLMATTGWLKQDGYASNKSGFNAFPANYKVQDASPFGEGSRCFLWTSEVNESDNPIVFQIVQLTGDTYASFTTFPIGYFPQHLPLRLVRDK